MKRILLSMMVLAVASIASYAQSTGDKPFPGAKHTYKVDKIDGHKYSWSVKVAEASGALVDANAGDATLTGEADAENVTIDWNKNLAAASVYYVQVEDVVGGCSIQEREVMKPACHFSLQPYSVLWFGLNLRGVGKRN